MLSVRDLINKLYEEAAPNWGYQQVEEEYDEWWAGQDISDKDICAMYDKYMASKDTL